MNSPLPRRRSLALLAILALLMVVLSYMFILAMAAACAYLPYLLLMNSGSNLQIFLLLLCGLGMSGAMLWSLVPRRDDFKEPGLEIDRLAHPQLFVELERIAAALNESVPEQ